MNITDCFGDEIRAHTVLDTLAVGKIMSIEKEGERFRVTEACDGYFSVSLSKANIIQLGNELIALANSKE